MQPPSLLVVDDDVFFRTFCADILRQEGFEVQTAASGREALEWLGRRAFDLVLADIYMPGMTGLELLQAVKARSPALDVIIMTGYASIDTAVRALKHGAADYLRKPFAAQELVAVVEAVLAQQRLCREHQRLKRQLELYQLSRAFVGVEDPDRVLRLGLEAVCNATGCPAGLVLLAGPGGPPAVARFRGLEEGEAERVARHAARHGLFRAGDRPRILGRGWLGRVRGTPPRGMREALCLPFRVVGGGNGWFLMLRPEGGERIGQEAVENGRFLVRQVEFAYEAANRFQEARRLAYIDPLTDLYNARYLEKVLDDNIEESRRTGHPFSLLFLDLDRFKEINDAHGHLVGGKVLIEVSRVLASNLREGDILVRYGGDEFIVVLPGAGPDEATEVAERIRAAVRDHRFLGREGRDIRLTASVGVATFPEDARSREELIDRADRAMYRNKDQIRDSIYMARLL